MPLEPAPGIFVKVFERLGAKTPRKGACDALDGCLILNPNRRVVRVPADNRRGTALDAGDSSDSYGRRGNDANTAHYNQESAVPSSKHGSETINHIKEPPTRKEWTRLD